MPSNLNDFLITPSFVSSHFRFKSLLPLFSYVSFLFFLFFLFFFLIFDTNYNPEATGSIRLCAFDQVSSKTQVYKKLAPLNTLATMMRWTTCSPQSARRPVEPRGRNCERGVLHASREETKAARRSSVARDSERAAQDELKAAREETSSALQREQTALGEIAALKEKFKAEFEQRQAEERYLQAGSTDSIRMTRRRR